MPPRRPLAALLLALSAAVPAAGFDCDKAGAPVEHLICEDAVLSSLDGALGDTFAARRKERPGEAGKALLQAQREWLKGRLAACAIPAAGPAPTREQRWQWAPCLAEQYRSRLTALGAPPEEPPPAAQPEGFIHPLCMALAGGDPMGEEQMQPTVIPLAACNAGNRHVPVRQEDGEYTAATATAGWEGWASYRPAGKLPDGRELAVLFANGGGSGVFSYVATVERRQGELMVQSLVTGGERCNGGIEAAEVGRDGVVVTSWVTPADLVGRLGIGEEVDLSSCASCCVATLKYRHPFTGGDGTLLGATLMEEEGDRQPSAAERCLLDLLYQGKRTELDAAALGKVAKAFTAQCLKAK